MQPPAPDRPHRLRRFQRREALAQQVARMIEREVIAGSASGLTPHPA